MTAKCDGHQTGLLVDFDAVYNDASAIFCSEKCPCNMATNSKSEQLTVDLNKGVYSVTKCNLESSLILKKLDESTKLLFATVEEESECSGVCENPGFYVFSNVNNG